VQLWPSLSFLQSLLQLSPFCVLPSSQSSPGSVVPLPHCALQSVSVLALAPDGQQPSPSTALVMRGCLHSAVQLCALPLRLSAVQASLSSQELGQGFSLPFSQRSEPSSTPLPQLGEQSESSLLLQSLGQQPSPPLHSLTGLKLHFRLQLLAAPVGLATMHLSWLWHIEQDALPGSQLSPCSTTPFPHVLLQSRSCS
jgi:hypothetical protein